MISKLQKTYSETGMVQYFQKDTSLAAYPKLAEYFHGHNRVSDISVIKTSSQLDASNPYSSSEELELHTESIGEAEKRVQAIFLTLLQKPNQGGKSLLVHTPSVISKLPVDFMNLEYSFRYLNMNYREKLIVKHPYKDIYTLNFTTFGIDRNTGKSNYIYDFGDSSGKNNQEQLIFLYDIIESLKFSINLEVSESILFDNFLYLHGRESYSGTRVVQRCEVYI